MFDKYISEFNTKFNQYKKNKALVAIFVSLILFVILLCVFILTKDQSRYNLSEYSASIQSESRTYFNLNSESGILYKGKGKGLEVVDEFIKKGGPIRGEGKMLPANFFKNSKIDKITKDSDLDPSYNSNSSSKEHYSYKQTINGVEVYGASLIVHLKNDNEIYSTSGNISTNSVVTPQIISVTKAIEIASNKAKEDSGFAKDINVTEARKMIFNFKILGISEESTNYLTVAVQVDSLETLFSKRYFVELEKGKIIYEENLIIEAKQRNVYDCNNSANPTGCPLVRSDNTAPSSVQDAELLFEYMGEVYDYYKNNFNRDGLDGRGSPLEGFVRIYSVAGRTCSAQPNAYNAGSYMAYCPGAVARDITAHEFGHGVVGSTVRLAQGYQYGALNESIADSFARALDGNWTMGEGSFLGIIRDMSNPPSVRNQPDKLFSNSYDCVSEEVHHNDGIPNKAFYLMTDGGSFNGCTITGIGIERAQQILYKTLASQYIPSTANFYDMYSGVNQACNDLYGSGSSVCEEVKKAYQATEMDQQPAGSSRGAKCTGGSEKTATCSNSPTSGPIPTISSPSSNPTASPTLPTGTIITPTLSQVPGSSTPTTTPGPSGGVFKPLGTPTPTPDQYYSCKPDPKCINSGKNIQLCPLVCTPK